MLLKHNNNNNDKDNPTQQSFVIQLKKIANSDYQQKLVAYLQAWHYATLGAPLVTTLIRAINNNWVTSLPRLTADIIYKHLPKTIQTTMGHMQQVRKNICSTKKVIAEEIIEKYSSSFPAVPCSIYFSTS